MSSIRVFNNFNDRERDTASREGFHKEYELAKILHDDARLRNLINQYIEKNTVDLSPDRPWLVKLQTGFLMCLVATAPKDGETWVWKDGLPMRMFKRDEAKTLVAEFSHLPHEIEIAAKQAQDNVERAGKRSKNGDSSIGGNKTKHRRQRKSARHRRKSARHRRKSITYNK